MTDQTSPPSGSRSPRSTSCCTSACRSASAPANLGSWPVVIALVLVVLVFSQTAQNFFTPANFTNIITQMAGTCLLAYGVVFVLLIGEIDLSVGFVSGIAGVVVAQGAAADTALTCPGTSASSLRSLAATRDRCFPGIDRRADRRAVVRRHARRLRDLAGRHPAESARRDRDPGPRRSTTSPTTCSSDWGGAGGWTLATIVSVVYVGGVLGGAYSGVRHGIAIRNPFVLALKALAVPAIAFLTVDGPEP